MSSETARVYDLAEAHDGVYLIGLDEYASRGDEFKACEALVIDGFARWDRNSNLWPCIKLTSKPFPRQPPTGGEKPPTRSK